MNTQPTYRLYFLRHESWAIKATSRDITPGIIFGLYEKPTDSQTEGELLMSWANDGEELAGQLECGAESFPVLPLLADVWEKLAALAGQPFTCEQFIAILVECGFQDATMYERPRNSQPLPLDTVFI